MIQGNDVLEFGRAIDDRLQLKVMNPQDLIFEERVVMSCYYCGKYNSSWRCPPRIPSIDYKKMFSEYEIGAFVWLRLPFNEQTKSEVRRESSVLLHKSLLKIEKFLWNNNNPLALSFIAGSCKLCKNGCGDEKCNNPYNARTPLEATGCNVIESSAKYGISVTFPPVSSLLRVGLIVW